MKTIVLLSDARNPVSGRPHLSRLEAQAIALAAELDEAPRGLHVGPGDEGVAAGLGHGLCGLDVVAMPEGEDPLPALAAFLKDGLDGDAPPALILCGRRGEGGLDTGLVPYLLAEALGLPILADAVAIRPGEAPGTLVVDQAMAKGARRRITVRLPVVVTVHPLSPPPPPFAFGRMRRGEIRRHAAVVSGVPVDVDAGERPHRARPKLMRTAGTASGGANLHVGPEPEEAARLILAYLEDNGIRGYGRG
ncbi:hypothetical protein [Aurantimonas sp. 22II-16-19i]|uniref:hypothetical protein n=1 Tax=Aurantimonas sp. 22II-16-19i TaxID=1317114 RepID=UPI0009F7DB93|nr:hypothetical protein [Aurantimonas sp. 22II-16-19i]ORE91312.1 hypothetical protein ATO4_19419 [Aurantimonas sp. 22II-16-19i]